MRAKYPKLWKVAKAKTNETVESEDVIENIGVHGSDEREGLVTIYFINFIDFISKYFNAFRIYPNSFTHFPCLGCLTIIACVWPLALCCDHFRSWLIGKMAYSDVFSWPKLWSNCCWLGEYLIKSFQWKNLRISYMYFCMQYELHVTYNDQDRVYPWKMSTFINVFIEIKIFPSPIVDRMTYVSINIPI